MESERTAGAGTREAHATGERPHPGEREYVKVAVALAIVTALEIALFYIEALPSPLTVGLLIVLMMIKFALVALWFMHLRFDSERFMRLFVAGLAIAIIVFGVVLLTFGASQTVAVAIMLLGLAVLGVAALGGRILA